MAKHSQRFNLTRRALRRPAEWTRRRVYAQDPLFGAPRPTGTSSNDRPRGTQGVGTLRGGNGEDRILAPGGRDRVVGGNRKDSLFGG
jgi:Ca2+-binding RTX toxin-like protein